MTIYPTFSDFRRGDRGILSFFGTLVLLCWLVPVMLYFESEMSIAPFLRLSLSLSFTFVLTAMLCRIINNEIAGTKFAIDDGQLIRKSPTRVQVISFADVKHFRIVRVPFAGTHALVKTADAAIRIPLIIERLPDLIGQIRVELLALDKESTFEDRSIDAFIRRATVSQASSARLAQSFPKIMKLAELAAIVGFVAARFFWYFPMSWALGWALISLIIPFCGAIFGDTMLSRQGRRNIEATGSIGDLDEKGAFLRAGAAFLGLYLMLGIGARLIAWAVA